MVAVSQIISKFTAEDDGQKCTVACYIYINEGRGL